MEMTIGKLHRDGKGLVLPAAATTQKFAFLGQSGSGKTYGSGVFVEKLLEQGSQVVIFDEVGVWYGLRLLPDGKTPSPHHIPIFGGDHGDRPLEPDMGAQMAKALVATRSPAILDVSGFTGGERAKFGAAFGETFLLEKKKSRSPVMIVLEEAQDWVPQRPMPEENRMKGAFVRITKLGRNYGIGITFLSQRPQAVDKDALSQVECLVAFKVQEAHARKSLVDWIAEKGEDVRGHVDDLPKLQKGEALVWSPAWLQLYERVKIGTKTTFDASSTPADVLEHTKVEPVSIESFDAFFESAEAEDCKHKGKRTELVHKAMYDQVVAELESLKQGHGMYREECLRLRAEQRVIEAAKMEIREALDVVKAAVEKAIVVATAPRAASLAQVEDEQFLDHVDQVLDDERRDVGMPPMFRDESPTTGDSGPLMQLPPSRLLPELPGDAVTRKFKSAFTLGEPHRVSEPKGLRKGARRMLAALASYPKGLNSSQLQMMADLSRGGTFDTYMADLRRLQYVETTDEGLHRATTQGRRMAGGLGVSVPQTEQEVLGMWRQKLRAGARRMFDEIVKRGARGITREELALKSGLSRGGTFDTYMGDIMRTGCFTKVRGTITVRGDLKSLCS